MKPTYIGFNTQPYATIWWQFEKYGKKPTYCFSEEDLQSELERYRTPGDFYYKVPHVIEYHLKQPITA